MHQFEVVKFSLVADSLPQSCMARLTRDKRDNEFNDETVLHIWGNATFASLDLDEITRSIPLEVSAGDHFFLILIEGNLTVSTWIGNENNDGATNLIVKGNLQAADAVFGGQQVYVGGDMLIENLLWGMDSDGSLTVVGTTVAGLFIATEQYHFDLHGERRFKRQLIEEGVCGGDWELLDLETLEKLLEPDCLMDHVSFYHVDLMRDAVLDRLKEGKTVLRKAGLAPEITAVPTLFVDRNVTIDNILQAASPKRMSDDLEGRTAPRLEFWFDNTLCRTSAIGDENELGAQRFVYLQDETHALFFKVELREESHSWWQKISGKQRTGSWHMGAQGRGFHPDGDEEWQELDTGLQADGNRSIPQVFHPLLATGWNALLNGIATYDYASTLVRADEIRRLLSLPVVEPYDDFYGDSCGFWHGQLFCAFRQEGALYDDKPQAALLRVDREYTHADGRCLVEMYFFSIRRHFDGTEGVFITYIEDQDCDAEQLPLSFLGGRRLELARRAFNTARRNLESANCELVENAIPPNWEDDFAVTYWRKKGLILGPAPVRVDKKFTFIESTPLPVADRAMSPAIGALYRRLQGLGFEEREKLPIMAKLGLSESISMHAAGENHLLSAGLMEQDPLLTLDIYVYFDVADWDQVSAEIEKIVDGVLQSKDRNEALFMLPEDFAQLQDQEKQSAGVVVELVVPEREPDQDFEHIMLIFNYELAPKEAQSGEMAASADARGQDAFLKQMGWHAPELPAWQISIAVATRPPIEWMTRRNILQPDDMWLSLTLNSLLPWKVKLMRHDGLFVVEWTARGIRVESAQLRYRKIIKWPEMSGPADFPLLISELNALFTTSFSTVAQIILPKADHALKQAFSHWLADVCDTINFVGHEN